jgi:hypothetical protein
MIDGIGPGEYLIPILEDHEEPQTGPGFPGLAVSQELKKNYQSHKLPGRSPIIILKAAL